MERVVAMILAGGKGTRMGLLCQRRAKPVVPFAGAFRVIDFTLSNCVNSGVGAVGVLVDYGRESVKEYVGSGLAWGLPFRGRLETRSRAPGATAAPLMPYFRTSSG